MILKDMTADSNKLLTLCIVHQQNRVLLGMKKVGFGVGKWNGFGGKVEAGEGIEAAAKRELEEEAGITAKFLKQWGIIEFMFQNNPQIHEVHVFKCGDFSGEPTESDEMRPQWFEINDIPFSQMWPDDIYWIPFVLENKMFKAAFSFDENEAIAKMSLEEVDRLL